MILVLKKFLRDLLALKFLKMIFCGYYLLLKLRKYFTSSKICQKQKNKKYKFFGNNGGKAKKYSTINLIVPSKNTARIQEVQKFIGHFILEQTEKLL